MLILIIEYRLSLRKLLSRQVSPHIVERELGSVNVQLASMYSIRLCKRRGIKMNGNF